MTSRTPDQSKAKVLPPVLVGLLLTLVVPLLWVFVISPLVKPLLSSQAFMIVGEVVFWGLALGVIALVVFWERQPLSSVGVRGLTWKEGVLALLLSVAMFVLAPILVIIVARVIGGSVSTMAGLGELAEQSMVLRILLALRAGVTEEILYRAYPTERMKSLTGKAWVGALVGLVVFTILHVPGWGWGHSIGVVLPIGLIFAGLYLWKRNLTLNIVAHFLTDLIPLLVVPLLPPLPL